MSETVLASIDSREHLLAILAKLLPEDASERRVLAATLNMPESTIAGIYTGRALTTGVVPSYDKLFAIYKYLVPNARLAFVAAGE